MREVIHNFNKMAMARLDLLRKRLELVPILDSEIIGRYARSLGEGRLVGKSQSVDRAVVADMGLRVLRAFRDDLVPAHDDFSAQAARRTKHRVPLGPVRVLEILVWTEVEPRGYYR